MKKQLAACLICGVMALNMTAGSICAFADETEYVDAQSGDGDETEGLEDIDEEEALIRADMLKSMDELTDERSSYEQAIADFIMEYNADTYEKGDVTFCFSNDSGYNFDESDDEGVENSKLFGDFWEFNYKQEDGILKLLNGGCFTAIITTTTDDDGETYTVTDAQIAAEGEDSWPDVQKFCADIGISTDVYLENHESFDIMLLEEFIGYANTHPEITGIDDGEKTYTVEEAKQEAVDYWVNWMGAFDLG